MALVRNQTSRESTFGYKPIYIIQEKHRIGALLPSPEIELVLSQLYLYDTEYELNNRLKVTENFVSQTIV